jgi:DNA-directed RNA polymerase beta' subunit
MGVIEPGLTCPTDNCKYDESPGHFGHIQLELPVIHIGFVNLIKTALKATCNLCSKVLLHSAGGTAPGSKSDDEPSEQDYYRRRVNDVILKYGLGSTEFSKIIKSIEKLTSDARRTICMHCGAQQGKIVLDKPTTFKEHIIAQGGAKATERKLNSRDIREWLQGIPKEHLIFLGMYKENRPEWIVLKVLPVPPITVRPSIILDSGDRSEDDLTHKLVDILRINQRLRENRDAGAPDMIVKDLWELLQYHVTTYFDNQTSGIPPSRHRSGRTLKTLTQRLKGKEGRFRSNLSGKRVNFCARTVISPDPKLGVNEVGVPVKIAKELTVPIRVTTRNREQMRQMMLRGPHAHPGVNYAVLQNRRRVRIDEKNRHINAGFRCHNPNCYGETTQRFDLHSVMPAPNFLPGLVVKRYTKSDSGSFYDDNLVYYTIDERATLANLDGEDLYGNSLAEDDPNAVLHYRWKHELTNPDLPFPPHLQITCPHCGSPEDKWGKRTRVEDRLSTIDMNGNPKPGLKLERHLIDGDVVIFNRQPSLHRMSMMVHEVRVIEGNTFRFNPIVCSPYNADFDGDEMNLHVPQGEEARAEGKILMRVQENIISPRNGNAIVGGFQDHIMGIYLLTKEGSKVSKNSGLDILGSIGYTGDLPKSHVDGNKEFFWGRDLLSVIIPREVNMGFLNRSNNDVRITNGGLAGTLDKRAIGSDEGRLINYIINQYGTNIGVKFLDNLSQIAITACDKFGITSSLDEVDLSQAAIDEISRINIGLFEEVDNEIWKFGKDGLGYEVRPGRTPKETLEENIMAILDYGKQITGDLAKEDLRYNDSNFAVDMALSGARGSMDNLAMMAGSIGQAKVRGRRPERGYLMRILPHFKIGIKGPTEKGYITSSFKRGLNPTEFFMLSISGRESLVDTAVRTSKSGYLQRRLINAMDDVTISKDKYRSARNTANRIIQFSYGEDGINPAVAFQGKSVNIDAVVDNALGTSGPIKIKDEDYLDRFDREFDLGYDDGDSGDAAGRLL